MKISVVEASTVISDALSAGGYDVEGSSQRLVDHFVGGVRSTSGFIVDGSPERFAQFFLAYAAGNSGALSEAAVTGGSGFTVKGDYQYAWARRFFDGALSGGSGFTVKKV